MTTRATTIALATVLTAQLLVTLAPAGDDGPEPKPAEEPPKKTVLVELFTSQG